MGAARAVQGLERLDFTRHQGIAARDIRFPLYLPWYRRFLFGPVSASEVSPIPDRREDRVTEQLSRKRDGLIAIWAK